MTVNCVVCGERITDAGWDPACCEVCWDSMDADEQRNLDKYERWFDD